MSELKARDTRRWVARSISCMGDSIRSGDVEPVRGDNCYVAVQPEPDVSKFCGASRELGGRLAPRREDRRPTHSTILRVPPTGPLDPSSGMPGLWRSRLTADGTESHVWRHPMSRDSNAASRPPLPEDDGRSFRHPVPLVVPGGPGPITARVRAPLTARVILDEVQDTTGGEAGPQGWHSRSGEDRHGFDGDVGQ